MLITHPWNHPESRHQGNGTALMAHYLDTDGTEQWIALQWSKPLCAEQALVHQSIADYLQGTGQQLVSLQVLKRSDTPL